MSVAASPANRAAEPASLTAEAASNSRAVFEYLLAGDLRQLLEEPIGPETNRWLLATLDMILANRPRPSKLAIPAVVLHCPWEDDGERIWPERGTVYEKLQRLRDRIAHRAPYALLANEIRCDLAEMIHRFRG